jgi:hypothetical protein
LKLNFSDAPSDQLGEILWDSFISARLAAEPALREQKPRPEWANQDDDTKALWRSFAQRLIALYGQNPGYAPRNPSGLPPVGPA